MPKLKRPYRGMRGDYVLEQNCGGTFVVVVGGTEESCRREKLKYRGELRVTPNRPGDPVRDGSYRVT